jgi:hypothetical protein
LNRSCRWDRHLTSPAVYRCAKGREMSGSTREAGTAITAGEVPQLKVVSGCHSDTRNRIGRGIENGIRGSRPAEARRGAAGRVCAGHCQSVPHTYIQ